jgi:hypothetical protein
MGHIQEISVAGSLAVCLVFAAGCGPEPTEGSELSASVVDAIGNQGPCRLHADCASLVCDAFAAAGHGKCIEPGRVLYVSNQCASPNTATGRIDDPFCQIRDAVPAAVASNKVLRVMPGSYLPFIVSGAALEIYGPAGEGGVAQVSEEDLGAARVSAGAQVLIDGFALGGPTHSGLICDASRAVVRRSTLRSDVGGGTLQATGCELELDRIDIRSQLPGLVLTDTRFSITNTFVGESNTARPAIILQRSEGTFRFSTLTAAQEPDVGPHGTIDCGDGPVRIEDSIVAGNGVFPETGSRFSGACQLDRVVVGDDPIASQGAIHATPILEDGYRLPLTQANLDCCIDRASPGRKVRWDIEGTSRPQGKRSDIGAFELIME